MKCKPSDVRSACLSSTLRKLAFNAIDVIYLMLVALPVSLLDREAYNPSSWGVSRKFIDILFQKVDSPNDLNNYVKVNVIPLFKRDRVKSPVLETKKIIITITVSLKI